MKLTTRQIECISKTLAPEFAPLPRPFLVHLLSQQTRYLDLPTHLFKTPSSPAAFFLEQLWQQFNYCRNTTYTYLSPFAIAERLEKNKHLTTRWLQETIATCHPLHKAGKGNWEDFVPSMQTVSDWYGRGLFRKEKWGTPKGNSASAIIIMRSMITKERGWLPAEMSMEESDFWVWGIGPGESIPMPYPYPPPSTLPSNTLLWSPWPLASLDEGWVSFNNRGAFRWAGTCLLNSKIYWDLSLEEMKIWDSQLEKHLHFEDLAAIQKEYLGLPSLSETDRQAQTKMYLHAPASVLLNRVGLPTLFDHFNRLYTFNSPPLAYSLPCF